MTYVHCIVLVFKIRPERTCTSRAIKCMWEIISSLIHTYARAHTQHTQRENTELYTNMWLPDNSKLVCYVYLLYNILHTLGSLGPTCVLRLHFLPQLQIKRHCFRLEMSDSDIACLRISLWSVMHLSNASSMGYTITFFLYTYVQVKQFIWT